MTKYLGLIAVIWFWLVTATLLIKYPRDNKKSISQHSAGSEAYYPYTFAQTIAGALLWVFVIFWLIPHFHLSGGYKAVMSITIGCQIIAAYFPDTDKGTISMIHKMLAYGMAIGMLVFTFMLSTNSNLPIGSRIFSLIAVAYMIIGLIALILYKKSRQIYLPLQAVYIGMFLFSLLIPAFI